MCNVELVDKNRRLQRKVEGRRGLPPLGWRPWARRDTFVVDEGRRKREERTNAAPARRQEHRTITRPAFSRHGAAANLLLPGPSGESCTQYSDARSHRPAAHQTRAFAQAVARREVFESPRTGSSLHAAPSTGRVVRTGRAVRSPPLHSCLKVGERRMWNRRVGAPSRVERGAKDTPDAASPGVREVPQGCPNSTLAATTVLFFARVRI